MNAIMNEKGRQTKLLATIAIIAMVVCALAIAIPASESDAVAELPDANKGVYTLTDSTYGSSTAPIQMNAQESGDISFVLGNGDEDAKTSTVYLTYEATSTALNLFSTGKLTITGPITVYITVTCDDSTTTARALYNMDVALTGGATLVLTSGEKVASQIWWNSDAENPKTLTLGTEGDSEDFGKLVLDSAGGFSSVNANLYGKSSVVAQNTEVAAMNFNNLNVDAGASVKIADGTSTYINFVGAVENDGTIDAGNSTINMGKNATLTNNETGKVSANEITGDANKTAITNNGTINAKAQFTDADGNVTYLSGPVSSNDVKLTENAVLENVTVNPGVTLEINKTATVKGDMRVYGTIAPATAPTDNETTATLTVGQDATLTAYAGASVAKGLDVISTENGKIDLSAAMSTVTLNDDIESDFNASQSQKVVIADTLTIKTGYKMTILGELVINEGCTVIIEDGAKLIVGSTGKIKATGVTVNGNIEVENGGTIEVQNAEDVTVVGTITSSGTVTINSNVTVKNGGSIVIEDYENDKGEQTSNIDVDKGLTVEAGGELSIAGNMYIGTISNKGTVTLDGAIIAERSTIQMTAAGAVVDIKSMTQKVIGSKVCSLIVEDYGLYLYTDKETEEDVTVSADDKNIIAFDGAVKASGDNAVDVTDGIGIRNITITSVLETEQVDKDTTNYYNQFVISGSPSIYDDTVNGDFNGTYAINMNAYNKSSGASYVISSIEVPESLTIGKNVNVTLGNASFGGVMNVDGTIDVTADGATLKSNGQIYVNGMITVALDNDAINSGINAFNYEDDDNNYYTTLKTAVDNAADDIEYLGNVKVLDSLTIPAGTELSKGTSGYKITIGDEDNRDVIVTIADGATVRNCYIDVMATLVFEDNKTDNRATNKIYSDVIIDETPKRTYTNIYTALDDAADNSTVTINRNVFLDKDAEIRETITLAIPASYGVYLDDEVTLTVNGTIQNSGKIGNDVDENGDYQPDNKTMAGFNPYIDADTVNSERAEIVVNGTVMSMDELSYETYFIVGAYYQLINDAGAWNYITPVEQAAVVSNDVENGEIEIYGENTVGDVAFTGDADQAVTVTVYGDLDAGTVTLTLATLDVKGSFDGTVGSAVGTIDVVNGKGFTVVDTLVGADDVQTLYLTGNPVAADEELDASVTVATGTVNAGQIEITAPADDARTTFDFVIASGATLMVAGDYDGNDAKFTASEMTVDGTLVANDDGLVNVTTLTVRGTFTIMAADDEADTNAGKADITTLYVGIAKDDKTNKFVDASAATVNAESLGSKFANAYVSGESTITADLVSKMYSTEFYVEDVLWLTAYSAEKNKIAISTQATDDEGKEYVAYSMQPGDLNNSAFVSWNDENGEALEGDVYVGDSDASKVYATLDYDIYTVTVFADPGITAVYIDGKLMPSGYFQTVDNAGNIQQVAGFQLKVAAGEHEITYKLGNYFSGEAKMTVNGSAVDSNKFTTSGTTTADMNVTIYLQGINASAPETPSTTGGDDGMGLTDYLLIILVVLIVVMAIIVALRLMRS